MPFFSGFVASGAIEEFRIARQSDIDSLPASSVTFIRGISQSIENFVNTVGPTIEAKVVQTGLSIDKSGKAAPDRLTANSSDTVTVSGIPSGALIVVQAYFNLTDDDAENQGGGGKPIETFGGAQSFIFPAGPTQGFTFAPGFAGRFEFYVTSGLVNEKTFKLPVGTGVNDYVYVDP